MFSQFYHQLQILTFINLLTLILVGDTHPFLDSNAMITLKGFEEEELSRIG